MNGDLNTPKNEEGLQVESEVKPQNESASAINDRGDGAGEVTWKQGDVIMERYEVLNELGKGGMGVVYRCLDKKDHTKVALKRLPRELTQNQQEMRELRENFRNIARIVHKNIAVCRSLDKDSTTGNVYLVTECVNGVSLTQWMDQKRKEGMMTLETALLLLKALFEKFWQEPDCHYTIEKMAEEASDGT